MVKTRFNHNELPTIVCLHFGVAEDQMKGNWWFESCPETALLGNRKELKEILKTDNLDACPDYKYICKREDKKDILVEQIRKDIIDDIYLAPVACDKKVYITLGNHEKYLVISHITNNDKDYYYIAELEENGKDIKDNYKIMLASEIDGKTFLDEVVGETNLKIVLPLFVKEL